MCKTEVCEIVEPDLHTKYLTCCRKVIWNVKAFADGNAKNGFIVQKVHYILKSNSQFIKNDDQMYFEAWPVHDGIIIDEDKCGYDDRFCVGAQNEPQNPTDPDPIDDVFRCIGYEGSSDFYPVVYWLDKNLPLYHVVETWLPGGFWMAGNLKSIEASDELNLLFKSVKEYRRERFEHIWSLNDSEKIKDIVVSVCQKRLNPTNEKDRRDFYQYMKLFLKDDKYKSVKEEIIKEWDNLNKEEETKPSTDVRMTLDPAKPLSDEQKQQIQNISNFPDAQVCQEAEADPDCEPLR